MCPIRCADNAYAHYAMYPLSRYAVVRLKSMWHRRYKLHARYPKHLLRNCNKSSAFIMAQLARLVDLRWVMFTVNALFGLFSSHFVHITLTHSHPIGLTRIHPIAFSLFCHFGINLREMGGYRIACPSAQVSLDMKMARTNVFWEPFRSLFSRIEITPQQRTSHFANFEPISLKPLKELSPYRFMQSLRSQRAGILRSYFLTRRHFLGDFSTASSY